MVLRLSGLLPPAYLEKHFGQEHGTTFLAGAPLANFLVDGTTLRYVRLPLRDELVPVSEDFWHGTGSVLGLRFCTFRLVRARSRQCSAR